MKSKFSTDTSVKEAFLQVALDKKSKDDNNLQEILNGKLIFACFMAAQ